MQQKAGNVSVFVPNDEAIDSFKSFHNINLDLAAQKTFFLV